MTQHRSAYCKFVEKGVFGSLDSVILGWNDLLKVEVTVVFSGLDAVPYCAIADSLKMLLLKIDDQLSWINSLKAVFGTFMKTVLDECLYVNILCKH